MLETVSKPRWYHVTPERFLIALLATVLLVLLADRLELFGLTRGSGWNVLLALAVVCLGMLGALFWFVASLLLRRRFQFSLKSLLVLTVVVAIPCSWFAVKMQQANRQKEAVKAIREMRGAFTYEIDLHGPFEGLFPEDTASRIAAWSRNLVGTDFLSPVARIRVRNTRVTDARLVILKELTKLEQLHLAGTQVSDAGLMHLKELTNLKSLTLDDTQVTDAGLVHLKELANLENLYLSDTQVTDAGLVHLKRLTNLKRLRLNHTEVTDAELVHLKGLTNLKELELDGTQVTDAGIRKLQQALPNCRILR